ncbi:hypothetical protein D3C87_517990 [compost metagenome]
MFRDSSLGVRIIGNLIMVCLVLLVLAYGSVSSYNLEAQQLAQDTHIVSPSQFEAHRSPR